MRTASSICVAVGVLISGLAHADCTKPDIPACAVQSGGFATEADYDRCRKQMLAFKSDMESHSLCAAAAGRPQEGQASAEELEATLARFNRRARGE
jgi:hypothetical protein